MRGAADAVVIGGGIMGLSTAYHLASIRPDWKISVLEASYLCSGASGRNGGGVRAQWSSELLIRLMIESLELCRDFARQHKINTWFRRGGYLFLVRSKRQQSELEASVKLQNACGLRTRMLEQKEVREVVPELETKDLLGASHNPDDAVVFPWPFIWGYAEGARALGVEIETFTRVVGIETAGGLIQRVLTDRGTIQTPIVINAAGALSPEVARLVGVEVPTRPHRHEICSTEPLKPWLTPLVADLENGLYFSQSTRGEIVGGVSNARVPEGTDMSSSMRFMSLYSRALLRVCPILSHVKVLRQWAGLYDLSPDHNPIVGPVDDVSGFFLLSGFMGHGFMMGPVMGKYLAEHISNGDHADLMTRWNLRRFKEGKVLEERLIIG
jgi:sarcosine oxidase, subunit beta